MSQIIKKLPPHFLDVLDQARQLSQKKGHFFIDIQHFLFQGLVDKDADFQFILRHYDIDVSTIVKQLHTAIERMDGNAHTNPAYSLHFLMFLQESWLLSSVFMEIDHICGIAMMLALVDSDPLRGIMLEYCPLFLRIPRHTFKQEALDLLHFLQKGHSPYRETPRPSIMVAP